MTDTAFQCFVFNTDSVTLLRTIIKMLFASLFHLTACDKADIEPINDQNSVSGAIRLILSTDQPERKEGVMKRMMMFFALAVCLTGCATTEQSLRDQGMEPLSQAELEALFEGGKTANYKGQRSSGTVVYNADGTQKIDWGRGTDTGQYQIRDGKFCSKWKTLRSGAERCVILFKVGENHYQAFHMDGSKNSDLYFK